MVDPRTVKRYRDRPRPVAGLAGRQHGVVASRQLETLGWSRATVARAVRNGRLIRLHRGVYAVGHARLTIRGRWMAAVLACGKYAVLSHRDALALWDLSPVSSGRIEITALHERRIDGVRSHRTRSVHPDDRTVIDGIPVTSLPRTFLDQAETLHPQRLRTLMEQAQRRDMLNFLSFEALFQRAIGHHGAGKLKAVLAELQDEAPWTQSELERRFLEFLREHRLAEPQTNVIVDGVCVDCFWPEANLIAELDGYQFHKDRRTFESDRRKDIAHVRAGRRAVHITQRMLTDQPRPLRADLDALLHRAAA